MPAWRSRVSVGKALVKIRLAIAVHVVQSRDLIAPEHVDHAIDNPQSEWLIQSRGKPPPAQALQRFIEPAHDPHLTHDCANHAIAIREKIVITDKKQRLPWIRERQRDRVHGERLRRAPRAARFNNLRPLRRSAFRQCRQRMGRCWRDEAHELSIFDRRRVEHLHPITPIAENHTASVPMESVIDKVAARWRPRIVCDHFSFDCYTLADPVTKGIVAHKSALPHERHGQRLRIEAARHFAGLTEPDANTFHNRLPAAAHDSADNGTEVGFIPAAIPPERLVLISPMSLRSAIEAGILDEQCRRLRLRKRPLCLLGVKIEDTLPIHRGLPCRPEFRLKWLALKRKLRGSWWSGGIAGESAEVQKGEQEKAVTHPRSFYRGFTMPATETQTERRGLSKFSAGRTGSPRCLISRPARLSFVRRQSCFLGKESK
jgi:hypothetical protein